ncbi:MAG TPA: hypothetical protein EYG89_01065 [Bacteroidia bacterium]|nr:hypothetical protein [Bacteroidia bacterium]
MRVDITDLKNYINPNIIKQLPNKTYEIKQYNAIDFLVPERFDLLAKILYVKHKINNTKSSIFTDLYLKHIEAFNGFYEADGSNKIGKEKFVTEFDKIIDSINKKGLFENTVIPSSKGVIVDGAHRVATSIYFNKSIKSVSLSLETINFDYNYFRNRGLSNSYLDLMALEYINLKKSNLFLIFLWPSNGGQQDKNVANILKKYGKVVYRKNVELTKKGSINLIRSLYENENWVGSPKNNYIGAMNKANWCFNKSGPVKVVLFESDKDMIVMKGEIRELFDIQKHSIHITDTIDEVQIFSKLIFNSNTINWLNHSSFTEFSWFNKLFKDYRAWITENNLDPDNFCIDGSSTLSAYGIRTARDIDFFYSQKESLSTGFKEIDCHNSRFDFNQEKNT